MLELIKWFLIMFFVALAMEAVRRHLDDKKEEAFKRKVNGGGMGNIHNPSQVRPKTTLQDMFSSVFKPNPERYINILETSMKQSVVDQSTARQERLLLEKAMHSDSDEDDAMYPKMIVIPSPNKTTNSSSVSYKSFIDEEPDLEEESQRPDSKSSISSTI